MLYIYLQYPKIKYNHTTTYRNDYTHYGYRKPDVTVRRAAAMRDFGLSRQFLLNHLDGNKYTSNLVSNYDEFYNGRWRENTQFPQLRTWNKHTLKFVPEKSDFPLLRELVTYYMYANVCMNVCVYVCMYLSLSLSLSLFLSLRDIYISVA